MSHSHKTSSDLICKSLPTNAHRVFRLWGNGTPLCACRKASYTLEAAVILPLTTAFLVFFLFFFRVMQVQTAVQEALSYAGRKTASCASLADGELADFAVAEAFFRTELRGNERVERYVQRGSGGISLLHSDVSGDDICLRADYRVVFPLSFFRFRGISVTQSVDCRKWTGKGGSDGENLENYIYITETGSVYHKNRNCTYLKLSIRKADFSKIESLRNDSGEKYYPCERCAAKNSAPKICYITDYGNRYHTELSCSGLKRTVFRIPKSEAEGWRGCSKCVGKEAS